MTSTTDATARLDPHLEIADIDRRLFGGFVEHLGRHIYDGIFEPGHPSADDEGFRTDVIELVKELGVSTIRYPGGNFVSGYKWEDGIGPKADRPRRLDLAWHSTETNEVGLHEFQAWLDRVGSDLMLAVNLGTRGTQEALDVLEYANADTQTAWTDQRAANGRETPFGVKMWCLGNEMDGPWQVGHRNADDYGKLASRTAKAMRMLDPGVELVVCGSSARSMPTFGSWERIVLEHTFDDVDFISCHSYYQEHDGDAQEFLASGVDMARFIESVVAIADTVAATKKSDKRIMISFDEWNVWYLHNDDGTESGHEFKGGAWPVAPRLLEDKYNALDAVVFGDLMITLLQHADRVPHLHEREARRGRGAERRRDDRRRGRVAVRREPFDDGCRGPPRRPLGAGAHARPRGRRRRVAPPARRRPVRGEHARGPRARRRARGRGIRRRRGAVDRAARGVVGRGPARLRPVDRSRGER